MRSLRLLPFGLFLSLLAACSQPDERETVRLDLPDPMVCLQDYSYERHDDPAPAIELMHAAVDQGDPAAMLCRLAFNVDRGHDYIEFQLLYRYYRAANLLPERLEKRVRAMDRDAVSIDIFITHRHSPELAELERGFWNCLEYDAMATELLLRAPPGGDMSCLPRRFLGGRALRI
jgi:hypothetical protein